MPLFQVINLITSPDDSELTTKRLEHLFRSCSGSSWLSLNKIRTVLLHLYRVFYRVFQLPEILGSFNVAAAMDNNQKNLDNTKCKPGAKSYFIKKNKAVIPANFCYFYFKIITLTWKRYQSEIGYIS